MTCVRESHSAVQDISLCAEFILGKDEICLRFLLFSDTEMPQVFESIPPARLTPGFATSTWLLMTL